MDGDRDQGVKEVKEVKYTCSFHSTYVYREKAVNRFTSLTWFTDAGLGGVKTPTFKGHLVRL